MRKFAAILLLSTIAFGAIGCSGSSDTTDPTTIAGESKNDQDRPEKITINSLNGNKEKVEVEIPYDPQRIAILDLASLDIIDNLGMGDRVVGMASTSIDYLSSYSDNKSIANIGTIKEADLEAVMKCEPDVIFIGGRLAASYDALSEIAPVVYLATDTEIGVVESVTQNATTIASLFGLEGEVTSKTNEFKSRIEALAAVAENKTAVIGMTTSGSFNLLGNDGRCSIIGVEIGFDNLVAAESSSTHGNESSFETVVKLDPDYIFVLDRDSAISTEGAKLAKEIMENELITDLDVYKSGNIVYLSNPSVWYTAEGGISALDIMISDIESALISK